MIDEDLVEALAEEVHKQWMATRRAKGVSSRLSETGEEYMVAYSDLSEAAKDLDRHTVRAVLRGIEGLGMRIEKPRRPVVVAGPSCQSPHNPPPLEFCNGPLCEEWAAKTMETASSRQCDSTHRHDRHLTFEAGDLSVCPGRDSCE